MPPMPPDDEQEPPAMPSAMPQDAPEAPEAPEAAEPAEGEVCLPLDALGMPDEQDQMETPAVGDKGQANIEWTLNRVEGGNGYVTIDAVNGKAIEKPEAEPTDEDEGNQLQGMAAQMPPPQ